MVHHLFQNYYTQFVDPKNKNRLDLSLLYKNQLDLYVAAQKWTRFLMQKNRPNFYCTKIDPIFTAQNTKIDPIFIAQKLTRFLLHKNQGGVYFTDRIEILQTNTFSD